MEIKEIQDIACDIMVEFDKICRKYNLKYSLEGGSLLGAVKYGGFVPWDDDIDVIMLRKDYEEFIKIAQKELSAKYFVQTSRNTTEFPLNYAKICYKGTEIYDYEFSHLKMNHGVFIDIFPIDNIKLETFKFQFSFVNVLTSAVHKKLKIKFKKTQRKKFFLKRLLVDFFSLFSLSKLRFWIDKQCTKYNKQQTKYRYEICNGNKNFQPLLSEIYDDVIETKFNDNMFFIVKEYDYMLKSRFGEDYMDYEPPRDKRIRPHCSRIRRIEY